MQDLFNSLYAYCEKHSTKPDVLLDEIERATHLHTLAPRMLSGPLQGSFLSLISKMVKPRHILEIGTFTGYAAIALAQGLNQGGKLTTIELNPEHAYLAEQFFLQSIYKEQIQLIVGDAKKIIAESQDTYDLVFIDADKEAYAQYFDLVIDKCHSGSIILVDNVLWSGKVIEEKKDRKTQIIHDFNQKIAADTRVEKVILPIRDGITLIRKI